MNYASVSSVKIIGVTRRRSDDFLFPLALKESILHDMFYPLLVVLLATLVVVFGTSRDKNSADASGDGDGSGGSGRGSAKSGDGSGSGTVSVGDGAKTAATVNSAETVVQAEITSGAMAHMDTAQSALRAELGLFPTSEQLGHAVPRPIRYETLPPSSRQRHINPAAAEQISAAFKAGHVRLGGRDGAPSLISRRPIDAQRAAPAGLLHERAANANKSMHRETDYAKDFGGPETQLDDMVQAKKMREAVAHERARIGHEGTASMYRPQASAFDDLARGHKGSTAGEFALLHALPNKGARYNRPDTDDKQRTMRSKYQLGGHVSADGKKHLNGATPGLGQDENVWIRPRKKARAEIAGSYRRVPRRGFDHHDLHIGGIYPKGDWRNGERRHVRVRPNTLQEQFSAVVDGDIAAVALRQ